MGSLAFPGAHLLPRNVNVFDFGFSKLSDQTYKVPANVCIKLAHGVN